MSNLASTLKSEISRLARKEMKAQTDALRKASSGYRRDIAELKRQVAVLSRQVKKAGGRQAADTSAGEDDTTASRFSAKGLKSLRARLDLSAADFGKLAGASAQSVYNWENGKTIPRATQVAGIVPLRSLGKREAQARLEALSTAPKAKAKPRAKKAANA
ncbi:helix-turn-helix domain-containing protein [Luteimonas sp. MC1825]|uniref:helix-turn-helix domain-containing protein n=1 Tax=Luteimonas sp. MC1825 TaxID=2761107 RepID=UPI00160AA076|nr:helix-turn-helix domain-containing protein [Luteimonas sp. MC1825]MBB6598369.1 helix-turn-helix domain-containing protein [Luteimonas sp. MC1825]QOC88570.1 helix-turn-helix domain-containing protein [Luteimonas sp. MC1825]